MSELKDNPREIPRFIYDNLKRSMRDLTMQSIRFLESHREGLNYPDGLEGIHPNELYQLGRRLLDADSVWDAYGILAEPSTRGIAYYDETIGRQHQRGHRLVGDVMGRFELGVDIGLDIGAGTGSLSLHLGRYCRQIIALDMVEPLLKVAGKRLTEAGISHYLITGDATKLDMLIPSNSVDILVMQGIEPYLSLEELEGLYINFGKVLKPRGRIYFYQGMEYDRRIRMRVSEGSPRQVLSKLVGGAIISRSLQMEQVQKVIDAKRYGFSSVSIPVQNEFGLSEAVYQLTYK